MPVESTIHSSNDCAAFSTGCSWI